jgi:hypothetical protein
MAADTGLDVGFLIGTEDVILGTKAPTLPFAGIQIQNRPAFSAKGGSRGKIQYLYRHGLMASVSSIRHTVLRLIGVPRALRARAAPSARD